MSMDAFSSLSPAKVNITVQKIQKQGAWRMIKEAETFL